VTEPTRDPPAWQPPVPFAEPVADPFPVKVLPPALAAFVQESAAALGCAADLVGVPLLAAAGAMIGTSRILQVRPDRREGTAIFLAVVAEAGSGAAEALQQVAGPLFRAQGRILARHEERLPRFKIARAQYRPPKPLPALILPGDEHLYIPRPKPRRPVLTRLCAAEVSAGALAGILRENPRGALLLPGDLPAWLAALGPAGRRTVRAAWGGEPVCVDRPGRGPVLVAEPFLGIVASAGPERLALLRQEAARADGLLDRFLFTFPDPGPAPRWRRRAVPAGARRAWANVLARLRRLAGDPARPGRPRRLPVDRDGRAAWERFYDRLAEEMNGVEASGPLRGPWVRLQSYGARLALVLHYLWWTAAPRSPQLPPSAPPASNGPSPWSSIFKATPARCTRSSAPTPRPDGRVRSCAGWSAPACASSPGGKPSTRCAGPPARPLS
jgi:hypothetical protein